jgi:threonyl-tRNA synthetase
MIVPVSLSDPACVSYAQHVQQTLFAAGFDVAVDLSDATMQRKIRDAQLLQYNYILVVGAKEMLNHTVSVRTRDNIVHGERALPDLIAMFRQLCNDFK